MLSSLPGPVRMLLWLAVLGAVVYFGTQLAGKAARNV